MKRICLLSMATLFLVSAGGALGAPPQAICVPWVPEKENIPHDTYSGAQTTLKGIARGGATQYRWDYGDGTPGMAWTPIVDPYNLGVKHAYTGADGQQFVATLYVKDGSGQEDWDTYPVMILKSSDLSDSTQLDVRIRMSIDEGLWYLHTHLNRGSYPAGAPGYGQPYGYSGGGNYGVPVAATGASLDALQTNGHKVTGDYDGDPYVETVQREVNFLLVNTYSTPIGMQPAGNPDTNESSNLYDGRQTYIGGICVSALAECGAPEQIAAVGGANVYNRKYKDIVQDMVDFFAWGQCDSGTWRGGWRYYANEGDADMSTTQWPPLAMLIAEKAPPLGMGATVPQFVRDQLPNFLGVTQIAECNNDNGGFGYYSEADEYPNDTKVGAGLICFEFLGVPQTDPRFQQAIGFLYRHWDDNGTSWSYAKLFGNSYGMFGVSKALRIPSPSITHIAEYDCVAGRQTGTTFDWFYTPSGQPPPFMGMATYIVDDQQADGHWDDSVGPNAVIGEFCTAWRILALGSPLVRPAAVVSDCDKMSDCLQGFNVNEDIPLDGSHSYHPTQTARSSATIGTSATRQSPAARRNCTFRASK